MSQDQRNSILLWLGTVAVFGLFWAGLHFDVLAGVPQTWVWRGFGVLLAARLILSLWSLWRRRRARPKAGV